LHPNARAACRLRAASAPIHARRADPGRPARNVARVRAISLPTALPVAAAALALVAAGLAPLAVPSTALAERWLRPVPGEVARPFDYSRAAPFAGGAHRGVDLAAPPGTPVQAACAGHVVHAGPVAGPDEVVSVRCGDRRVSYLPLATTAVEAGETVAAGTRLGTLAPGHGGLHLGVRREHDHFGYIDPTPLLSSADRAPPPLATSPRRPVEPRPIATPAAPRAAPRPGAWPAISTRPLAGRPPPATVPWPVWIGLAALLTGAVGSRAIVVRRRASRQRAGTKLSTETAGAGA
jgi:murein DD-endopeptidase MepM/ murein hydrolase activator NlpD